MGNRSPSGRRISDPEAILARWPGRCPFCAGQIDRGDLIVQIAGEWVHDACPASTDEIVDHDDEEGSR